MGSFQVLFSGDLVRGEQQPVVEARLAAEFRIDASRTRQLFAGRTVVLRSNLSESDAVALQQRLFQLGAVCRIKETVTAESQRAAAVLDRDAARFESKRDETLEEITAAFMECPRCAYMQLDSTQCARCGVDIEQALARKRREDRLIEQQIRELRARRDADPGNAAPAASELTPIAGLRRLGGSARKS